VQAGTFFALDRQWKRGDEVTLELPMSWRLVKGRQRQAGRVAVMRGPQVFCLNPIAGRHAREARRGRIWATWRSTPTRWELPFVAMRCARAAWGAKSPPGSRVSAWLPRPTMS